MICFLKDELVELGLDLQLQWFKLINFIILRVTNHLWNNNSVTIKYTNKVGHQFLSWFHGSHRVFI